jgi:proline dehydrogenase
MDLKRIIEEFDPDNTGMVDYITWSMNLNPKDLPKITAACREVGPLALAAPTEEEIELIEAMYERGHALAKEAAKCKTCLLIDAEQVRFQPAIDNLVLNLQQTYNSADVSDFPVIYNTYQCYLKDSYDRLRTDVERADRFKYHFGAKLVRGAYMESERKLAEIGGFASPIHDTMEETHKCYDESVEFLLEHSTKSDNRVELMCATHNQLSIEKAIAAMNKYGVDRSESIICFAQLYGMKDNLSFNLGKHGYRAYKYVPYGEVHEVMPYLLRRARENSAIVGGAVQELCLIKSELRRRVMG